MNGLLAIYKKQGSTTSRLGELLDNGLKTMSHRGSITSSSFFKDGKKQDEADANMAMGACSLHGGASHIASHNGNLLFFEGRLINKPELGKQLSIASDDVADAEVVLKQLEIRGSDCLASLKGFWSLIYFDAANKLMYCARDHFGCRTLFYCNSGNQFAVSTESRTLYTLFDDSRSVDKYTVTDFLLWGNIGQSDQYFFKDIKSIEPSHFLKYDMKNDSLTVERYYDLPYNKSNESYKEASEKQYLERLRTLLTDSVNRNLQLFDGVPAIGVSGGMDSSSLICTAKKLDPQKTIVAYTTTDKYDGGEVCWAEKVVRHTGAEWIKVVCTAEDII
ncbi:MAG: hypothetical protein LBT42_02115, partial [Tannerella sp.]|nr:hypothetical protein [Tannerella sp.]